VNASHSETVDSRRALVLGGGGAAGNAWMVGVIAGMADAGLALTEADVIVGTSAGAAAAIQISSVPLADLYDSVVNAPVPAQGHATGASDAEHLERVNALIAQSLDAADMRRRVGAAALGADSEQDGVRSERWRAIVATRLPVTEWPERRILITAVDATTGEPVVMDKDSGVDLVDAVAASSSPGLAHNVGGHWLLGGGYRRNENADLAAGYGRVVVLSPLGGRNFYPVGWRMQLAAQVEDLEDGGSQVATVIPDEASLAEMGDNFLDPCTRSASAQAGFEQGRGAARHLKPLWR
jgi:NTE family protein